MPYKGFVEEDLLKRHWLSLAWPALLLPLLACFVFAIAPGSDHAFLQHGLFPRKVEKLYGILTTPLLHASWEHLVGNLTSLLVLGLLFRFSFPHLFWSTTLVVWILGGFWTWLMARNNFHIGASGLVYGYVFFLVTTGLVGKNYRLVALSLLTVFLYGSLVWGLFPIDPLMSFESHLAGAAAGICMAVYHRSKLPKIKYAWEDEPEDSSKEPSVYRQVRAMEKNGQWLDDGLESSPESNPLPQSIDPLRIVYEIVPPTSRLERNPERPDENLDRP